MQVRSQDIFKAWNTGPRLKKKKQKPNLLF